ncbi:MAG TPA: twin-arginine translocation signal domain-containing protein [Candidatus Bathyarchaeia archaeon]|nr:twin-arginine translocation signal domain-containing protein [Candidatus Bathyarchaeia archaeon]
MSTETRQGGTSTTKKGVSRRDFLKYSAGVAAVAAGATSLLGTIPSIASPLTTPSRFLQTGLLLASKKLP